MKKMGRNKRFRKLFLSYFIGILISLILIGLIYLMNTTSMIEQEYKKLTLAETRNLAIKMETLFQSAQNMSVQISFSPSLNEILMDPNSATPYDYKELREELSSYVLTNPIIHSIYVYLKISDKVITTGEGIYNRSEFFERDIIDVVTQNDMDIEWLSFREIPDIYDLNDTNNQDMVISFSEHVPITRTVPLGNIIVNMRLDVLHDILNKYDSYGFNDSFIIDQDGHIVVHDDESLIGERIDAIYISHDTLTLNSEGVQEVTLNNNRYFSSFYPSSTNEWTYVTIYPTEKMVNRMNHERKMILIILFAVLLLGTILSYFFSVRMHFAWKQLISKLGNHLKSTNRDEDEMYDEYDDYKRISHGIDRLIERNNDISEVIEQSKPIIKYRVTEELLWNNDSAERIRDQMEFINMKFEHSMYFSMVASITGFDKIEDIKTKGITRIYIMRTIEQVFLSNYCIEGIFLEDDKFAFVINLEQKEWGYELKEDIKLKCKLINDILEKKLNINLCFSFGSINQGIDTINSSFVQALKKLSYKAFINEGEVLFSLEEEASISFPFNLQKQIVNAIKASNNKASEIAVNRLFDEYIYTRKYSYEKLQHMIMVLIGTVVSEFWREGINLEQKQQVHTFDFVFKSENSRILKQSLIEYFNSMMNEKQKDNHYIDKTIMFIKENYTRDISINDIAEHVSLHPTYLGRIFKNYNGKPVIKYLSYWRIEKAKEMFDDDTLSIQDISLKVGFNDVHSFNRYFKKYEGVTPGQFRSIIRSGD